MSPARRRETPLSRTEIARAALAIVDRDGVEQFTMRQLAIELEVATMAVYHHFGNKAEVLQAAADQVWVEAALAIRDVPDPIDDLVHAFLAVRRAFEAHAEITPYGFGSPTTEEAVHRMTLGIVERFERAGFAGAQVGDAYNAVATFTFGSALLHAQRLVLDRMVGTAVSDLGEIAPGPGEVPAASQVAYDAVRDSMVADPGLVRFERTLRDVVLGLVERYALR